MSNNTPNRGNNLPNAKEDIASQIDLVQYENESDEDFQRRIEAQGDQPPVTPFQRE